MKSNQILDDLKQLKKQREPTPNRNLSPNARSPVYKLSSSCTNVLSIGTPTTSKQESSFFQSHMRKSAVMLTSPKPPVDARFKNSNKYDGLK